MASYAAAWREVAEANPEDLEAQLFAALSMISTAASSGRAMEVRSEAVAMAEAVLAQVEDHPGAHHYIIHAYDNPAQAEQALGVARNYGKVAPDNAHALHMTSHIFTRVGEWQESIDYNERSADAAMRNPVGDRTSHHHLHAVDYLAYAYLQRAEDDRAAQVLEHLKSLSGPVVDNAVSAYALAAVPARMALERQEWDAAHRLEPRTPATVDWDRYPHLEAIPHFARALGAARSDDMATARASAERLAELAVGAEELPEAYDWGTQVRIQEMGARAWIAFAEGHRQRRGRDVGSGCVVGAGEKYRVGRCPNSRHR